MNQVNLCKGWPPQDAPSELVNPWYEKFPPDHDGRVDMKTPTRLSKNPLHTIKFIPKTDFLFPCWIHKVSASIRRGGFTWHGYTSHVMNRSIPHVHRARPLNGSEIGSNLAENRIEYVLLTSWDGNFIFFSANRAQPGSQKLLLNGSMKWNFLRNKEKAYQNRE